MEIDGVYFSAAQAAANMAAFSSQKKEKTNTVKGKTFASAMERAREESQLVQEGLPVEIAGMDVEEAAVFLKDAADIAADRLKESQLPEVFADYKKKVSQFLKFVVKNNFDVVKKNRIRTARTLKKPNPHTQVQFINEKLDEMAKWLLSSHKDTFKMLQKIEEIQGLIVDLMAT